MSIRKQDHKKNNNELLMILPTVLRKQHLSTPRDAA